MTGRAMNLRSWLLTGMLVSVFMLAASGVKAQDVLPCKCDVGTITVGKVPCKFEVCIKDAAGFVCITVGPGSTEFFKCHENAVIFLKDCQGNLVQINNAKTNCVQCICVGDKCCVTACVSFDAKGCINVKIGPGLCPKICF